MLEQPTWLYHPRNGAKLFTAGQDRPKGWYETPDKFPKPGRPKKAE